MMSKAKVAAGAHEAKSKEKSTEKNSSVLDPALKALFDSSIPREAPKSSHSISKSREIRERSSAKGNKNGDEQQAANVDVHNSDPETILPVLPTISKKRKRTNHGDEIEEKYLKKLALEEEKDRISRKSLRRNAIPQDHQDQVDEKLGSGSASPTSQADGESDDGGADMENYEIPQHESISVAGSKTEVDKAGRTVFLGNVSTEAIKSKTAKRLLLEHLVSFTSEMNDSLAHKVESIRFRSTAFSDSSIPKKAAFAKQQLMEATTKSTNAYVVYSTTAAAREATKRLNGTIILDRHLRVDSVAHPAAIDHQRCVFVGNLGFVDDESNIRANETEDGQKRPKAKEAADIEEGLWVHFAKAGPVESVRVVRDRTTRVGKGIAYVQFKNPNSVEKALLMNEKKFPPMLPRKLRISRARKLRKTSTKPNTAAPVTRHPSKQPAKLFSLAGRADRMLGRAGAHHMRKELKQGKDTSKDIIFEGHRAVPSRNPIATKDKKKKRPDRRTSRSTAYRSRTGRT